MVFAVVGRFPLAPSWLSYPPGPTLGSEFFWRWFCRQKSPKPPCAEIPHGLIPSPLPGGREGETERRGCIPLGYPRTYHRVFRAFPHPLRDRPCRGIGKGFGIVEGGGRSPPRVFVVGGGRVKPPKIDDFWAGPARITKRRSFFGDRQRRVFRSGASWNFSTRAGYFEFIPRAPPLSGWACTRGHFL